MGFKEKVLISGTGRAGTTVLVEILTNLGFDTGFNIKNIKQNKNSISLGGLEINGLKEGSPEVIKSPLICDSLEEYHSKYKIKCLIVPIRDLEKAAKSRVAVSNRSFELYKNKKCNGGLWNAKDKDEQINVLANKFYKLIHKSVLFNIPIYFIHFPTFVYDKEYLYDKLTEIFKDRRIDINVFNSVFDKIIDKEMIGENKWKN